MARSELPPRAAELVLVTPDGRLLGRLPPVPVPTPWWQDVEPVVAAVRAAHGVAPRILRLLDAERPSPPGGRVTYLAEATPRLPRDPGPASSTTTRSAKASRGRAVPRPTSPGRRASSTRGA